MSKLVFLAGLATGAIAGAAVVSVYGTYQVYADSGTCGQSYPNIPGQLLLENEKVVVQRFSFPPDQWEGVHAHPANQLYIHLTDAHWKVRYGEKTEAGRYPAGSIGWFGPVELDEDHESVNIGEAPIDLIWVTLKAGCTS